MKKGGVGHGATAGKGVLNGVPNQMVNHSVGTHHDAGLPSRLADEQLEAKRPYAQRDPHVTPPGVAPTLKRKRENLAVRTDLDIYAEIQKFSAALKPLCVCTTCTPNLCGPRSDHDGRGAARRPCSTR